MSTERGDRAHVLTDHSDRGLSSPKTDTRCEVRQRLPEPLTRFRAGNLHHGIEFLVLGARGGGEARRSFRRVELPALCRAITSSKVGVARTGEAPALRASSSLSLLVATWSESLRRRDLSHS